MSANSSSSSRKACCFCNSKENDELEYGKIYEHDGIVTHYYCLLLSSNMEQKGNDDEGILGFLAEDIQKELRRGKRLVCSYCKKIGATLGCCNIRCKKIFHLPCGLKAGSLHQFFGEFRSYCVNHRPKQKVDEHIVKQIGSVDNVLCYICYDKVNADDFVKTLWAPCCKKDAWFHRNCIQQLALSAGYFFKCPLCNNKKDFQKAMLEYGIFVPSQDASWELVPNAFEELLYRHDQCDATKCLCPKGRKYTSNNAKWELALCRTCGSQGIHMACGQLKWANPVWECEECTSILRNSDNNKCARLNNSSTIGSSSQNKDSNSDSDSEQDSDSDSDLDSDTDISVGTDFPMPPYSLASNSSSSLLNSSLDSILDVKLRPGPRSFKLQQQMNKLEKCRLDLANTNLEKNITTEVSLKDTRELLNDDEKKKPSISKENIFQQGSKEDSSQNKSKEDSSRNENKENSPRKEKQVTQNGEKARPKEADVITIESDNDDVEIISLIKPKINETKTPPLRMQQSTQSSSSRVSDAPTTSEWSLESLIRTMLNTKDNSAKLKSAAINLLKYDDISLSKSTVLESKAFNTNETIALDQVAEITPRESTSDVAASNSELEETNTEIDLSKTSLMNIKITNVTSLPPEVFESVPDVCSDVKSHENTTDTSSLSQNKMLEQLFTHALSTKRSIHEVNGVTDNRKKIKSFDEKLSEASSAVSVIVANNSKITKNDIPMTNTISNMNRQQNVSKAPASEIINDKNFLKCISASRINILPPLNNIQKNDLPTRFISLNEVDGASQIVSHLKKNGVPVTKNDQVYLQFSGGSFYLQPIPNPSSIRFTQNADKTNVFTIPSSNTIHKLNNANNVVKTMLLKEPINKANVTAAPVPNTIDNRILIVNQQGTSSKGDVLPSTSSVRNDSTNKSYCDGDAGTRPAETESTSREKDDLPSDSHRSGLSKQEVNGSVACNVFPQVTNNHNTCRQPRLIPRYMNLHDLKFRICDSNNVQMTLYDMFSVKISLKNSKNNKNRLVSAAVPQESQGSPALASLEASCSSDYTDNTSTERQCTEKFFRSLTNCSINDKSACAKYVTHDDAKENLDPVRPTRILSCNSTLDNLNLTSNVDDTVSVNDSFRDEDDNEHLISSDINLSIVNRTICNTNVDNVTDNMSNQGSRVNLESVQQHKQAPMCNAFLAPAEKKSETLLFCKDTNRIVHDTDVDLNIVNMNKNIEKVSQDITVLTSRHIDGDRSGNYHTDDSSTLRNDYKQLDSTNIMKSKINNQNVVTRASNITKFNEHSILNKQIDACDSKKFIRYVTFQENVRNDGTKIKSNDKFCLKVSVDLCKIQNLIDSKPELFQNHKNEQQRQDANEQQRTCASRLLGLNHCVRQQTKYCDIQNGDNINNCLLKNREKSNTFLQRSNQGIGYFDKDTLDR
ncbi:dentin sialophosphoprotein [Monomorium pharaonis]|uniref:dentin sialophosphoprotein n=1 Tax=Monomorium pharaonis TaxID=307658 RepID=UPI00063FC7EC|nr:dentin sialophosphoprotein [Monomorium pharaonis]